MKKLIYTFLAASIIFVGCKKEEEEVEEKASIVGKWTPNSVDAQLTAKVTVMGIETTVQDTSFTMLPSDPNWDFNGDMEFTSGGLTIEGGDTTGTYTYSGNQLILTDDNGDSETSTAVVTSTSLTVTLEETDVTGDANNNSTMVTKMVLNCTRK